MTDKSEGRSATSSPTGENRYPDPSGLYRRWFDASEGTLNVEKEGSISPAELEELWKRWFGATAPRESGMESLWTEMAEDISAKMHSGENLPEDPLRFFLRWYKDTEERWSEAADELLRKSEILDQASHYIETYAHSYQELRRASEEGSKNLQVPSRLDISRVAKLVVVVENKVDRIEEAFEEFIHGDSEFATAGAVAKAVGSLEERMDRLESKMDHILAALESIGAGGKPDPDGLPGPARGKSHRTAGESNAGADESSNNGANGLGCS